MYYRLIKIAFIIAVIVGFPGCKKYPENNLWFKNPEKTFKGGYITSFNRNGVDLMPYYRTLYKNFPYNYYGASIADVFSLPFTYSSSNKDFSSEIGSGSLEFSQTKREVEITFKPINEAYGAENMFIDKLSWKIIKLTKSGQMKIRADYNFKYYEIQFN